ncbi:MAG: DnaJ domain-containing protein [Phormidesmis sp.]
MNLAQHYRTLGLRRGASSRDVKSAYRNLARRYHPDINPDEAAIEQFIKINDAYTAILEGIQAHESAREYKQATVKSDRQTSAEGFGLDSKLNQLIQTLEKLGLGSLQGAQDNERKSGAQSAVESKVEPEVEPKVKPECLDRENAARPKIGVPSRSLAGPASEQEQSLKQEAYQQLKALLRQQKFPRAIALVEGLAHRMPKDSEIIQWQAIVYQRWGRKLIDGGQPQKARIYLKKALRTDPNNQSLWREVNRDFWQLANLDAPIM